MLIENYHIGKKVSEDIIGEIYLANTTDLEQAVYFKFLHANFSENSHLIESFHQCAEAACSFNSDYQINTLSHGEDNARHYVILENFNLIPLQILLRQKKVFTLHEAASLIEKLALILRKIHLEDRIFGIMAPQHVFVSQDLQSVKISNLGFVDYIRELLELKFPAMREVIPFLAPELLQGGGRVDMQSDIYSLGAIFYRLLIGEPPHKEDKTRDFLEQLYKRSVIPPSLQRLEIPDFLDSIVLDALDPVKESRSPNLSQFLKQLGEAKATLLSTYTPTTEILNEVRNRHHDDELLNRPSANGEREAADVRTEPAEERPEIKEDASHPDLQEEEEIFEPAPSELEVVETTDDLDNKTQSEAKYRNEEKQLDTADEKELPVDDLPEPFDEIDAFGYAPEEQIIHTNEALEVEEDLVNEDQAESGDVDLKKSSPITSESHPEQNISGGENQTRQIPSIEEYEFDDKATIYFIEQNGKRENGTSRTPLTPQKASEGEPANVPAAAPEVIPKPQPEFSADEQDFFNDTQTQTSTLVTTMNIDQSNMGRRTSFGVVKVLAMVLLPLTAICVLLAFTFDFDLSEKVKGLLSSGSNATTENSTADQSEFFQQPGTTSHINDQAASNSQTRNGQTINAGSRSEGMPGQVEDKRQESSQSQNKNDNLTQLLNQKQKQADSEQQQVRRSVEAPPSKPTLDLYVTDGLSPLRAEVFINGRSYGRTDARGRLSIPELQSEASYIIKIQTEGYRMWAKEVRLGTATRQRLSVELHQSLPPAKNNSSGNSTNGVSALSQPRKGENGLAQSTPPAGRNRKDRSAQPATTSATVDIALSNPEPLSDVFIFVNGTLWNGEDNLAPAQLRLAPGNYIIEVRKEGYRSAPPSFVIDAVGGETQNISFILLPN